MELVDHNGRSLASATGQMCWHPAMRDKINDRGGLGADSYPHYIILTVHGITEVVEHRRDSFFSVTDDPTLVAQANEDEVGDLQPGEQRPTPAHADLLAR
jgi:hypothetical protein